MNGSDILLALFPQGIGPQHIPALKTIQARADALAAAIDPPKDHVLNKYDPESAEVNARICELKARGVVWDSVIQIIEEEFNYTLDKEAAKKRWQKHKGTYKAPEPSPEMGEAKSVSEQLPEIVVTSDHQELKAGPCSTSSDRPISALAAAAYDRRHNGAR